MKHRRKKDHIIGGQEENAILIPDFSVGASLALETKRGLFILKALLVLNVKK